MRPFRVFIGHDPRVTIATTVLAASLLRHSSIPLAITPLSLPTLPIKRRGLTDFTWSRFLVPYLCDYDGPALFLDSDIVSTSDIGAIISELESLDFAVACANTKPEFERAAVMLFNCGHEANKVLTPEYIETTKDPLHLIPWTKPVSLSNKWNFLVGYDRKEWMQGKVPPLIHYTKGIPIWQETLNCDYADEWRESLLWAQGTTVSYDDLMGHSVHIQSENRLNLHQD